MTHLSKKHDKGDIKSEAHSLLWSRHIKATRARLAIANLLLKEKSPLSFHDILKKCHGQSTASVYRTLELLVEKNLLHIINTGSRAVSYELMYGKKHHHHMICTGCGMLEDVLDCSVNNVGPRVLLNSKKFESFSHHSLEFFGICKSCTKR